MECPCKDCITKAVCRHKQFYKLLKDCKLIFEYDPHIYYISDRDPDKLLTIQYILEPTGWNYIYLPNEPVYRSRVSSTNDVGLGEKYDKNLSV